VLEKPKIEKTAVHSFFLFPTEIHNGIWFRRKKIGRENERVRVYFAMKCRLIYKLLRIKKRKINHDIAVSPLIVI
jgi:hypothetical protein